MGIFSSIRLSVNPVRFAYFQLAIDYRVAAGERLPFEEAAFDVVLCCDVLGTSTT